MAFGLSACSFWPYAHIATVDGLESENKPKKKTFNNDFGIAILALSFPFSTVLILGVLNSGTFFSSSYTIFLIAGLFLAVGLLLSLFNGLSAKWAYLKFVDRKLDRPATENV
ncbi:hypothetical protein AB1A65_03460 [Muricauda sp. ANG21]|uniref:hypothetical protein n=1 Tax=Allomuricauda sp. ANG21 TaxID=3042468 RepID=UPI003452482D